MTQTIRIDKNSSVSDKLKKLHKKIIRNTKKFVLQGNRDYIYY